MRIKFASTGSHRLGWLIVLAVVVVPSVIFV